MKATIKDIAKEVGVSTSTVSLVLNHKPCRVAQATRDKIFEVAQKYNYTVNQAARSLVTKKSKVLGMVIPDIENVFFSSLSKCIEEYCRSWGYTLMIVNSNDQAQDETMLIDLLVSRGVDGIFITVSNESFKHEQKMQEYLEKLPVPYVLVDRYYDSFDCNTVYFDNALGARLAIEHFVTKGHTKIACIGGPEFSKNGTTRVHGYQQAMEEFDCRVGKNYIELGDYRFQSGYDAMRKLLLTDVTAIFICNDMMTLGALKCLDEAGFYVEDDYSIISYDNLLYPYMQGIEITSIEQNIKQLAMTSCALLLKHIEKPSKVTEAVCLKPSLIEKQSVANCEDE